MVDTGAQDGTMGIQTYMKFLDALNNRGYQPVYWRTNGEVVGGVGGNSKVLLIADCPVRIAGRDAILRLFVLEDPSPETTIPGLMPGIMLESLDISINCGDPSLQIRGENARYGCRRTQSGHMFYDVLRFSAVEPGEALMGPPWKLPQHWEEYSRYRESYPNDKSRNPF